MLKKYKLDLLFMSQNIHEGKKLEPKSLKWCVSKQEYDSFKYCKCERLNVDEDSNSRLAARESLLTIQKIKF